MTEETTTTKQLTDVEALQINLEYATRLLWLVIHELGGEVTITKEQIANATFDEVRVSDTVEGGLHVEAVYVEPEVEAEDV
jgi:transposase